MGLSSVPVFPELSSNAASGSEQGRGGAMEGVGAAAAAAKRVEVVVEERLSESLRENGEARCSPSECHGCACGLKKPLIQIRAQGIHTSRTAKFPKGRAPHATSLASQAQLLMHPRNKICCGCRQTAFKGDVGEGRGRGGRTPKAPVSRVGHLARRYCGAPNRHQSRPVALVSPRTTGPSTCCRPALRTHPRAPSP